jgi:uncharacterized protein DUF4145
VARGCQRGRANLARPCHLKRAAPLWDTVRAATIRAIEGAMNNKVEFYPLNAAESLQLQSGVPRPTHLTYLCGACGESTNGRLVASCRRADGSEVCWFLCSCDNGEPTVMVVKDKAIALQLPQAREFKADTNWPPDLGRLFDEASSAYAAGAFTASAMASRKVLMACAVDQGDADGKRFIEYVDHIVNTVLTFPKARAAIDSIRTIGNDATHKVVFVSCDDARRALSIVRYLLNTVYSLPGA